MKNKQQPAKAVRVAPDIQERLKKCVEVSGLNETEIIRLAIKAGLEKIERGEFNPFTEKSLIGLTSAELQKRPELRNLFKGSTEDISTPKRWGHQPDLGLYFAPEFDHAVPAGKWEEIDGDFKKVEITANEIPANFLRKTLFVVRVSGDSMMCKDAKKSIPDGARLLMVQDPDPKAGDIVIGIVDGNGSTLKELVVEGGKAYLKALNPSYPKIIPFEKLECQGVMVTILGSSSDPHENASHNLKKPTQKNIAITEHHRKGHTYL
jgi:hypothetical protein